MSQTRLGSWLEVGANILIGFTINWCANMIVLPWFGFDISPRAAFDMGLIFTVIAIVRGYALRRMFNRIRSLHHAHPSEVFRADGGLEPDKPYTYDQLVGPNK